MKNRPLVDIVFALLMTLSGIANADRIAIIGTGDVGAALGPEFAALGHEIIYGSRDPERDSVQALVSKTGNNASAAMPTESVVNADIVVLAVPGRLAESITADLGDLSPVELGARNENLEEAVRGLELGQSIARRGAGVTAGGGR